MAYGEVKEQDKKEKLEKTYYKNRRKYGHDLRGIY
jgi:hypothetical protein